MNEVISLVVREFTRRTGSLWPWFALQDSGLGFGPMDRADSEKATSRSAQVWFFFSSICINLIWLFNCSFVATIGSGFKSGGLHWHPVKLLCHSQWAFVTTVESQTKTNQQSWNTWWNRSPGRLWGDDPTAAGSDLAFKEPCLHCISALCLHFAATLCVFTSVASNPLFIFLYAE